MAASSVSVVANALRLRRSRSAHGAAPAGTGHRAVSSSDRAAVEVA